VPEPTFQDIHGLSALFHCVSHYHGDSTLASATILLLTERIEICTGGAPRVGAYRDVLNRSAEERAQNSTREYDQVAFAFQGLIEPHVDQKLKKQVLDQTWLLPEQPGAAPETVQQSSK
jgi:hypothetical protein